MESVGGVKTQKMIWCKIVIYEEEEEDFGFVQSSQTQLSLHELENRRVRKKKEKKNV